MASKGKAFKDKAIQILREAAQTNSEEERDKKLSRTHINAILSVSGRINELTEKIEDIQIGNN